MNKPDLFQNSSAHPLEFQLVGYGDHNSPIYGASPTVGISKNGGSWIVPAGAVSEQSIAAPAAPMPTTATTGGTVAANTYYGVVTYTNAVGETTGSTQLSIVTTGATSTITIPSPAAPTPAATGWKAYLGTISGGPYYLQGSASAIGTNLTLTATPATSGANPPTNNSTSAGWYQIAANSADSNTLGLLKIHATAAGADPVDATYNVIALNTDAALIPASLDPRNIAGTAYATVSASPAPTTTTFTATVTGGAGLNIANVSFIRWEAGTANAGGTFRVTGYAAGAFAVEPMPNAPAAGDVCVIGGHQ